MNTEIEYLYRDAGNYKSYQTIVVKGEITDEQRKRIAASLEDGLYFCPRQIGLPEKRNGKLCDLDHGYFELETDSFSLTERRASPIKGGAITAEELANRFESVDKWNPNLWANSLTQEQHRRVFGYYNPSGPCPW